MITRKNILVASVAILLAVPGMALAQSTNTAAKPIMHSTFFNWADLKAVPNKVGERRSVFDGPTPALANLECHISTLNPGESPHMPHHHPDEEVIILKQGTMEAMQNGHTNIVEAGGIIFEASNEWHGLRNVGTNQAIYYVFKIMPHDIAPAGK